MYRDNHLHPTVLLILAVNYDADFVIDIEITKTGILDPKESKNHQIGETSKGGQVDKMNSYSSVVTELVWQPRGIMPASST